MGLGIVFTKVVDRSVDPTLDSLGQLFYELDRRSDPLLIRTVVSAPCRMQTSSFTDEDSRQLIQTRRGLNQFFRGQSSLQELFEVDVGVAFGIIAAERDGYCFEWRSYILTVAPLRR